MNLLMIQSMMEQAKEGCVFTWNKVSQYPRSRKLRLGGYLLFAAIIGMFFGQILMRSVNPGKAAASDVDVIRESAIMVVSVDRMGAEAELLGLWFLSWNPDDQNILFQPVYPLSLDDRSADVRKLARTFRLTAENEPAEKFLKQLGKMNVPAWEQYVIVDQIALANMLSTYHLVKYAGRTYSPATAFLTDLKTNEPVQLLDQQGFLLDQFCQSMLSGTHEAAFIRLATYMIGHNVASDLTIRQIVDGYYAYVTEYHPLTCEVQLPPR